MKPNRFIEIGIDFDNNPLGLGVSSEIENKDGTEHRQRGFIKLKPHALYLRIWIFKYVLVLSFFRLEMIKKQRHNFKIVIGLSGF